MGSLEATDKESIRKVREAIEELTARKSECENPEEAASIGEQIEKLDS